jgi:release factor glutamine methyltransferase
VGTGSGCIAVALASELPGARVYATDISAASLRVAAENARRLVGNRIAFCRTDLLAAVGDGRVDVVVANPPYVPESQAATIQREIREFEPRVAVFAGTEGIEIYARLVPEAARVLRPGGWVVFELGFGLAERVASLFGSGWADVAIAPDLAGIPRVISARRA